jgi:hypothetical protein
MSCPSEAETTLVDLSQWHAPVPTQEDLPHGCAPGALCFVQDEDRTYVRTNDGWRPARG